MQTTFIRRFTTSDQLTHFLNAIAWIALGFSGIAIGSALRAGGEPSHAALGTHFFAGAVLSAILLVYTVGAKARFKRMLHEIFRRDRHFFAWLRCLGGYPQKFFRTQAGSGCRSAAGSLQRRAAHSVCGARLCKLHARRNRIGAFLFAQPGRRRKCGVRSSAVLALICFCLERGDPHCAYSDGRCIGRFLTSASAFWKRLHS